MDYFRTKSVSELSKLHDMAFAQTSKATKTTFLQSMKRIEKIYDKPLNVIKLSFIDKPEEFVEKIEESKYSKNTQLTTITNILKLLKIIDAPLITYNKWLTILKDKTEERSKNDKVVLKKKLKVIMDWLDIKSMVYKEASKYIDSESMDMEEYRDFMILALFTIQIPARVSNYVGMRVVDSDEYITDNNNFLVVNEEDYKFIFNKYRTSHILGQKILFITENTLQYIIDKWLVKYNKDSNNFLIISDKNKRSMNGKQIEQSVENASTAIFGSPLTVDNLRASYMKRIADLDPDFQDKLDIAQILGYSSSDVINNHKTDE